MKEDFVTYDIAVKLRKKGFNIDTDFCYNQDGGIVKVGSCPAPQIHEVLKWLREERGIFVEISPAYIDITFYVSVYKIKDGRYIRCCILEFKYKSYEQAAIAGIEYVIDKLI